MVSNGGSVADFGALVEAAIRAAVLAKAPRRTVAAAAAAVASAVMAELRGRKGSVGEVAGPSAASRRRKKRKRKRPKRDAAETDDGVATKDGGGGDEKAGKDNAAVDAGSVGDAAAKEATEARSRRREEFCVAPWKRLGPDWDPNDSFSEESADDAVCDDPACNEGDIAEPSMVGTYAASSSG